MRLVAVLVGAASAARRETSADATIEIVDVRYFDSNPADDSLTGNLTVVLE